MTVMKSIKKTIKLVKTRKLKRKLKRRGLKGGNICSDSAFCLAFRIERDEIKAYFENFLNFGLVNTKGVKKIGNKGNSGFVYELPFEKDGYESLAVLKSAIRPKSDNLVYEGYVGMFLNHIGKFYPCFIETYGIGKYEGKYIELYDSLKNETAIDPDLLSSLTLTYPTEKTIETIGESCIDSQHKCLLVQHIKNMESLREISENNGMDMDMIQYLYQVYCPLDSIQDNFTHYDLHRNNAIVYYPSQNRDKCIFMVYHYPDGHTVEFKTFGLLKLIDYGRCFFKANNVNSEIIKNIICKTRECDPDCGVDKGFLSFDLKEYHINSEKRNCSHDLRLMNDIIRGKIKDDQIEPFLDEIDEKIVYSVGIENNVDFMEHLKNEYDGNPKYIKSYLQEEIKRFNKYGTPEIEENGYPDYIFNVGDAHMLLKDMIESQEFKTANDKKYKDVPVMGRMNVWVDGLRDRQATIYET